MAVIAKYGKSDLNSVMSTIGSADALLTICEQFRQGRCVLFLGSGISATYTDSSGRTFHGLPTSGQLLAKLRSSRKYVTKNMSLIEALTVKLNKEGRRGLLDFIREHLPPAGTAPLPAHMEIAQFPLSAIITTNWDLLIEESLQKFHVDHHVIVQDSDIPFFRPSSIPVLKFHGTINRPDTIVATLTDYEDLFAKRPVISSLLRVLFAQATVLFVGYSLDDPDFRSFYEQLKRELKDFMPTSFAVQRKPSRSSREYWRSQGLHIIKSDATDYLRTINTRLFIESASTLRGFGRVSDWDSTPFLRELLGAGSLPTESKVVDGILRQIVRIMDTNPTIEMVEKALKNALRTLISHRPNYQVLKHLDKKVFSSWFKPSSRSTAKIKKRAISLLAEREAVKMKIARRGAAVIQPNDKLLVYSQSTRVVDSIVAFLQGHPEGSNIELIVCERRHKSPRPVHDALSLSDKLSGFDVRIRIIPDASIAFLMDRGDVSKVLLGAHAIFQRPDRRILFTNTTGTLTVAQLAAAYGIPAYVLAEEAKIAPLGAPSDTGHSRLVQTTQEIPLADTTPALRDLMRSRGITYLNPGWDLISSERVPFCLITESRIVRFRRLKGRSTTRK
jgi:translation initiation factor 2B subunit (eIF-2B alpha/beta/delta family)